MNRYETWHKNNLYKINELKRIIGQNGRLSLIDQPDQNARAFAESQLDLLYAQIKDFNPVLSLKTIDAIEQTLQMCREGKLPMPRVINLSMAFIVKKPEANEFFRRLTEILVENDMLMVVAAGNDSKKGGPRFLSDGCNDKNFSSFTEYINYYPALIEHIIIVCASEGQRLADYSTRAGSPMLFDLENLSANAVTVDGTVFDIETTIENGHRKRYEMIQGTSLAAPRITALAAILGKYYQLTARQIKQVIINSTHKLDGYTTNEMGRGVVGFVKAWYEAGIAAWRPDAGYLLRKIMRFFNY